LFKDPLCFAAVCTMNKVAMAHPSTITVCNLNTSVTTLVITILQKTGGESWADKTDRHLSGRKISDEFKMVVTSLLSKEGPQSRENGNIRL
jgi:coatomer subunit gamma